MRRYTMFGLASLAAILALPLMTDAQAQEDAPLTFRVAPRSFLNPGNVVAPNSISPGTSGYGQTQSYLNSPPYAPAGGQFGVGALPDPVVNGPFIGARNPFRDIDIDATGSIR